MDDEETDELYMELLQRDTTISELNKRIDELESENEHLKKMIETLTCMKRKRGDDISCINCSLSESINTIFLQDYSNLNKLLCDYTLDSHYKFMNYILIGSNEEKVPIAILSDKMVAYQEKDGIIKYVDMNDILDFIKKIINPLILDYVNKMIEQHENDEQSSVTECLTSAETVNIIIKNTNTITKCELLVKKVIKQYQTI